MSAFQPLFINRLGKKQVVISLFCALLRFLFLKAALTFPLARTERGCC